MPPHPQRPHCSVFQSIIILLSSAFIYLTVYRCLNILQTLSRFLTTWVLQGPSLYKHKSFLTWKRCSWSSASLSFQILFVGGRCAYCYLNVPNLYVNLHSAFFFFYLGRDHSWLIAERYTGNHLFRRTTSPPNKLPYLIRTAFFWHQRLKHIRPLLIAASVCLHILWTSRIHASIQPKWRFEILHPPAMAKS